MSECRLRRALVPAVTVLAACWISLFSTAGLRPASAEEHAARVERSEQHPDVAPDRYFVRFRSGVTSTDIASARRRGIAVRRRFAAVRALAVTLRNRQQLEALARDPRVESIEPEPMRYALDLASEQLVPAGHNGLYGLLTTRAVAAHARATGLGINVGVADTSIDYHHPDIAPSYRGGIDTVGEGDSDPINDDRETHGTHVAGTILAANDSQGVMGVAYQANLYHARVLGPGGSGSSSDIMEGVRWLVEVAGCKVVNMSLGGRASSKTEEEFYKEMRAKGALIVCASGNEGRNRISFPAGYEPNIAVGAVDRANKVAGFSNKGASLDLVAPGVSVLSAVPRGKGSEAWVTAGTTYTAFGMEFAGETSAAISGKLVDCRLGQPGEFPTETPAYVALIERGQITFAEKVKNAMAAGAAAAVIYNNAPGDFSGTLGEAGDWIPAVGVSGTTGAALKEQLGSVASLINMQSSWEHYGGTSMAAPHVAGILALIWSANPSLSPDAVEEALFTTCADLGEPGFDTAYGRGLADAEAAVAYVLGQ